MSQRVRFVDNVGVSAFGNTGPNSVVSASLERVGTQNVIKFIQASGKSFNIPIVASASSADAVVSASANLNEITFERGNETTFTIIIDTGSLSNEAFIESLTSEGISGSFNIVSSSFSTRVSTNETNINTNSTNFTTLNNKTLISSSAQIADDISGSFTSISSSFSTRVTANEATVAKTLLSSSAQISDDISGSFTAPSSSFSTRVSSLEGGSGLQSGVLSSSAQIASDISGAFVAPSSSFSTRITNLKTDSGSFSTRVTSLEDPTSNRIFNNITASGNISASGNLIAKIEDNSGIGLRTVVYDTATGKFFRTGSYGGGGGSDFTPTMISGALGPNQDLIRSLTANGISGSFTSISSSFSTRVTANEATVAKTLLSSSAQIADDISGSFTSTSSSFSTRVSSLETNPVFTAAGISGSFTEASSSFSTRVTTNSTNITTLQANPVFSAAGISGSWQSQNFISASQITPNLPTGTLSSSAQIASNISGAFSSPFTSTGISGSFTAPSSSISTRLAALESGGGSDFTSAGISGSWQSQGFISASQVTPNLPTSTLSSSAQIADDISGSFTAPSSSISTRLANLEDGGGSGFTAAGISGSWQSQNFISGSQVTPNLPTNTISSSAQIASDISGAFASPFTAAGISGSFTLASSSFSTRVSANELVTAKSLISQSGGIVDLPNVKIQYANVYVNISDLPSPSNYHGMFAHVHNTGKGYFAHAGAWVELANISVTGSIDLNTSAISTLNSSGLLSSSAQISSDISGAFTEVSSSLSTRVSANETNITSITSSLDANRVVFTTTGGQLATDAGMVYDSGADKLTVTSLNVVHLTSSFITASSIQTSGSNIFGDDTTDTQTLIGTTKMTGSAQITGSLNVTSGNISGSFIGNGSGLTNLPSQAAFPFTGDAQITGSLIVSGAAEFRGVEDYDTNVVIGKNATSTAQYSVVIGKDAGISFGGSENVVIGHSANLANNTLYNVVIGEGAYGSGAGSVAIGEGATAAGEGVAIGKGANVSDYRGIAIGKGATAGLNQLQIGNSLYDPIISGSLETGDIIFASTASADYFVGDGSALTNLPQNFTAAGISGSFTEASASFSTRITSNESSITSLNAATSSFVTNSQTSSMSVATASYVETSEYTTRWDVTNNGFSAYRFAGNGIGASDDNPTLYLTRGEKYLFNANVSGHPFQIRVSDGGSAYNDGITNNGVQTGDIIFEVQMDAPTSLVYQCTIHSSMVGDIYIGDPQTFTPAGISGSFTEASSSFSTRVTSNEINITDLTTVTGSYATTGSNNFIGDQNITGHITASGNISASSGNIFGNVFNADTYVIAPNVGRSTTTLVEFGNQSSAHSNEDSDIVLKTVGSGEVVVDIGGNDVIKFLQDDIAIGKPFRGLTIASGSWGYGNLIASGSINVKGPTGNITASGNISLPTNISNIDFINEAGIRARTDGTYPGLHLASGTNTNNRIWFGKSFTDTSAVTASFINLGAITNVNEIVPHPNYPLTLKGGPNSNNSNDGVRIDTAGPTNGVFFNRFEIESDSNTVDAYFQNINGLGINDNTPTAMLDVNGNINTTSHITASGAISASNHISASSFNATPSIVNQLTASYAITASTTETIIPRTNFKPIVTHTTNFTTSASFAGHYNMVGGNLQVTVTTASNDLVSGYEWDFFQTGSGDTFEFVAGTGVSIVSRSNNKKLAAVGSAATLKYISGETFHLVGDLTT